MTEKRFYVDKSGDFRDTKTGNIIVDFGYSFNGMDCKMILDLLNQLNKENEQLKSKNKGLQSELHIFKEDVTHSNKIIDKLNDENEQLKKELEQDDLKNIKKANIKLFKENVQLKKELKSFKPIIFESDGKSVTLYEKRGDVE